MNPSLDLLEAHQKKMALMLELNDHMRVISETLTALEKVHKWEDVTWHKCCLAHIHPTLQKMNLERLKDQFLDVNADILTASNQLRPYLPEDMSRQLSKEVWECEAVNHIATLEATKRQLLRSTRRIREDINNPHLARLSGLFDL